MDINSKGKIRARKINYIQVSEVKQLVYPLKIRAKSHFKYFQVRETWRVTDFATNPMVLMMVLPMFFIMVLPKIMNPNDLETQKVYKVFIYIILHCLQCFHLQEIQNLNKLGDVSEIPELSEMVTNLFGNSNKQASNPPQGSASKQIKMSKSKKSS